MKEEVKHGKPWDVEGIFHCFEEADKARSKKLKLWEKQEKAGMQVKIKRRRTDGSFTLKTRLHPDFEPKLTKKKSGRKKTTKKANKNDDS